MSTWIDEFYKLNPHASGSSVEAEETKKEHKLDLFKVILPALDRRDTNFYENASEEHKKELGKQVWTLTRWMSSAKSNAEHHLLIVNDLVNKNSSDLKRHPELQWKLLALCGVGKSQMHQWIAPPKGIKKNKVEEAVLKIYPLLKNDDLELLLKVNSDEDLTELFKGAGLSDKEIKELLSK